MQVLFKSRHPQATDLRELTERRVRFVLRRLGWLVPLFVTLGSPLAVSVIKEKLARIKPIAFPVNVATWFNAMDERDVVSLYPLDKENFSLTPAIVNKTNVPNSTSNAHGISGYLGDKEVAKRIYDAVTDS